MKAKKADKIKIPAAPQALMLTLTLIWSMYE
jgi:hypothetical protein